MRCTVDELRERPLLIRAHSAVLNEGTVRPHGTCEKTALSMLALLLPRSPARGGLAARPRVGNGRNSSLA